VTIDTMRADHVGAYGYRAAHTPTLDRLARDGVRFDRAYAPAPITLTSHASLLTGRYPSAHGARDNGTAMNADVPTLATWLRGRGFRTAAFVAAFPLDKRFGLSRGFDVYSDRMPRGPDGRLANERPARMVVDDAITWLRDSRERTGEAGRIFLWVHLFEPHAPYGDPAHDPRPAIARYDDEISIADREVGRLLSSLGPDAGRTLVVVASDHGEAFGEHGETGHSLFVYDTTLRVALLVAGPRVPLHRVVDDPVCLIDVAPTVLDLLGEPGLAPDGVDLVPTMAGAFLPARALYAESFAPLIDFGWSPLRSVREGRWKAIAAPRPELYDIRADASEAHDLASDATTSSRAATAPRAGEPSLRDLLARIDRFSGDALPTRSAPALAGVGATDSQRARLGALGYLQGGAAPVSAMLPDPKDRRDLAARIAAVTSGELQGDRLVAALESITRDDPRNAQMQLRLGDALLTRSRCAEAEPHFRAAIRFRVPSADAHLGLASCQADAGRLADAVATLRQSETVEADNPVVLANLGLLLAKQSMTESAVASLRNALAIDPDFHEARFNLALVMARAGRRADARTEAKTLLARLPSDAPQRSEVERLLEALK
jgi:arylsulfatase A-like enzyme/Flp pilus assembly protein TadD